MASTAKAKSHTTSRPLELPGYPDLRCTPLTDRLAESLVARTLDPADDNLRRMTHDLSRFSCREQLARWHRRGREALCLQDAAGLLLGIVWIAEKPIPERDDYFDPKRIRERPPRLTWAIRLYGPARGQGLAEDFAGCALDELLRDRPGSHSLWGETRADNVIVTRKMGARLGFSPISGDAGGTVIFARFDD